MKSIKNLQKSIFLIAIAECCFSQPLSLNVFDYNLQKFRNNLGQDWQSLSNISSLRYCYRVNGLINRIHVKKKNNIGAVSFINNFYYNGYFSFFNIDFSSISGNYVNIKDSGIGFRNKWFMFQIGKGNESWGAGNDIELVLNKNSMPYDYFMFGSNYGRIRVNYIHGFLERTKEGFNRYINARGLEWTNNKSFIIGLSETIIYSGLNRPFDIAYLNPISSHLEIELNNRLNIYGQSNSNAVWQLHIDLLILKRLRFSLNYLLDEFVIDPDIETKKENGSAFSTELLFSILHRSNHILSLYFSKFYVGTPTFRHSVGTNNFVQNSKPMGWSFGSDGFEDSVGFNYMFKENIIFKISYNDVKYGEESILNRPYDIYNDYEEDLFPSGDVTRYHYTKLEMLYQFNSLVFFRFNSSFNMNYKIELGVTLS